jgi:nitroimidazol reductase NimA-like FMN-containing flavoprotein (pyridoxamine 5'-phosphate oxidase superfamily)
MDVLPAEACMGFRHRGRVGVMALAREGRAYAIPLFYAYDGKRLFFQSHPGEKDTFLEGCDEACFVVTEVHGDDDWKSVQATGPVEKITLSDDAMQALDSMAKNPFPPEFGVDTKGNPNRSAQRMYLWMMSPTKITGRSSKARRPAADQA